MPMDGLTNGRVPKAVLYDHNGREITLDQDDRSDGLDLPNVLTFGSLYQGAAYTYNHLWDEAMRHSRQNAMAMRRDGWLMGLLSERADETLEKKWHLEPDNPKDPWQRTVADGTTKIVKSIHRFQEMRRYLLEGALWYGRYGANVRWKWKDMYLPVMQKSGPVTPGMKAVPSMAKGKVLTITKHKPVNGDKLGHAIDDCPYVMISGSFHDKIRGQAKIIYPNNAGAPALLLRGGWREQILLHRNYADDADYFDAEMAEGVHGVGLRSRIYWLDFLRRDYFGAVTEMLNRIGLGIVVIYYDQSNATAKQEALDMAKKYSRRSVIVMPRANDQLSQSGAIEVIETPMAGATIMLELQQHVEDQIERFMVGQSISAGGGSSNPLEGTGKAEFARDTKTKRCRADSELFDDSLTGSDEEPGLVSIIKKWTYSFADFPLRFTTDHEENDPKDILEAVKVCVDMGVKFAEKDIREQTGLPAPEEGEPIIGGAKEALAAAQASHIAQLGQGTGASQGRGPGLEGTKDDVPLPGEAAKNPQVKPLAINLADDQPTESYAVDPTTPELSTKLANGQVVSFVPHPKQRPDEMTIMVHAGKLDKAFSANQSYLGKDFSEGAGEVPGRREAFAKFLKGGKPVEASRMSMDEQGVDFEDGRHRFAVLRDSGASHVAVTVPKHQVEHIQQHLGDGPKPAAGAGLGHFSDDQPIIPYHNELTIAEVLKRIRILGRGPASADYLRYLHRLLNANPQLRRQIEAKDLAMIQAMGHLAADDQL